MRPKTLTAALIPVVTASALAYSHGVFQPLSALYCVLFATWMQIAANLINDFYDFRRGTDGPERLGPERAMAQGWIKPRAMRIGIAITLMLACSAGSALFDFKGAEADQLDLVALGQRAGNSIQRSTDSLLSILLGRARQLSDFCNQFRFVHNLYPLFFV